MDAVAGVRHHGLLRDGEHDHRDLEAGLVDLGHQVHALDPALEQRVHQDHVRAELADEPEHARPVAHDVQQLDRGLRVEQAADVLRDLGDVLDDEETDLVRHRLDSTTQAGRWTPAPKVPFATVREGHASVSRGTGSGLAGHHDDALGARLEVAHVVVPGEGLHDEAGGLREGHELVG